MASVQMRTSERTGRTTFRVMFRIGSIQRQEGFEEDEKSAYEFAHLINRHGPDAALRALEARRTAGEDAITLREFTTKYLSPGSGMLTGVQPGTRAGYQIAAERSFLSMLGDLPVDAITKTDVGRWLGWQLEQPAARGNGKSIAPKTVKNYHALLSQVLTAAVDAKLRQDNPAHRTKIAKGIRAEKVFLMVDEFEALLHFIPAHYQRLVFHLANTGERWGEATALRWAEVHLHADPPSVRIERAWKKGVDGRPVLGPPKSQKSVRTISLSADAAASLGDPGLSDEYVFRSPTGGHIWYGRFMTSVWNPAVQKAMDEELCASEGLRPLRRRPTPHDLRHSHASWLIAQGAPLPYIQQRLGHESIQTTVDVYGHLVPDAHRQMAGLVGATLQGVRPMRQLAT